MLCERSLKSPAGLLLQAGLGEGREADDELPQVQLALALRVEGVEDLPGALRGLLARIFQGFA